MDELIAGYRKFRAEIWPAERARYEALSHRGQSPETMILACSDSRVDPQSIFSAVAGEMFVVRNVAAIAPPYEPDSPGYHGTSAALEFGVRVLKVKRLVVMGHGQCGGVRALLYGAPKEASDFVADWVDIARAALPKQGPAPTIPEAEAAVVRVSLANLMTFPWIAEAVADGGLVLHGYIFDIHTGVLTRVTADGVEPVE